MFYLGFILGFICNLYLVIFIREITKKKSLANCMYCKNSM